MMEVKLGKLFQYDVNYNNFVKMKHKESSNEAKKMNSKNPIDKEHLKIEKNKKKFHIVLPELVKIPHEQLTAKNLTFSYGPQGQEHSDHRVAPINAFNFTINRGERIALVGENGSGKSTLLKLLANSLKPSYGEVIIHPKAKIFYYAQQQVDLLDENKTILETVEEQAPLDFKQTDIRNLLSQFQFRGDDVYKRVSQLSGGEKSRVIFVLLFLSSATLLLLDEPFNHLDQDTCAVLVNCLQYYQGSFLLCNHNQKYYQKKYLDSMISPSSTTSSSGSGNKKTKEDEKSTREFITSVLEIDGGKLTKYDCSYEDFLQRKKLSE